MSGSNGRAIAVEDFPPARLRAVALAYRAAMGEGLSDWPAVQRAIAVYLRHGGRPEDAGREVPMMVAVVSRDHGEWFWRPVRERLDREEAALRALGWWPPPNAWDERQRVSQEAVRRVFGQQAGDGVGER